MALTTDQAIENGQSGGLVINENGIILGINQGTRKGEKDRGWLLPIWQVKTWLREEVNLINISNNS